VTSSEGWIPTLLGVLFMIAFCAGPPFLVAFLIWKFALRYRPLSLGDSVLTFAVSAASAVTIYGHFGPIPVVLLIYIVPGARFGSAIWMLGTGLLVTSFFFWRSRRVHT
jgi:hypothetical protein